MNWLRWKEGRQGTGYEKMLLATAKWPIPFDLYLLRYGEGAFVSPHIDPVPGHRHFRLNIFLKNAKFGGRFDLGVGKAIWSHPRAQLFRPDIYTHSVTKVLKGTRYVLSLGWLR